MKMATNTTEKRCAVCGKKFRSAVHNKTYCSAGCKAKAKAAAKRKARKCAKKCAPAAKKPAAKKPAVKKPVLVEKVRVGKKKDGIGNAVKTILDVKTSDPFRALFILTLAVGIVLKEIARRSVEK